MSYGIFTPDMKQTHTVLVPGMLDIHFRLFPAIFETAGYHVEVLYNEGDEWWKKASAMYIMIRAIRHCWSSDR
ncbi:MAG: hypothetical protein ACLVJX_00745 [Merdibacter sp.]